MVVLNYNDVEMSNAFIGYVFEQCLMNYTQNNFKQKVNNDNLIITEVKSK